MPLHYPASTSSALKGAKTLLLLAPERQWKKGWLKKVSDAPWTRLVAKALKEAKAGVGGTTIHAQNPDKGPDQIVVAVLPDERSRHNAPARPEAVAAAAAKAGFGSDTVAVIACAEEKEHVLPIARAVARIVPLYKRTSEKSKDPKIQFLALDPSGKKIAVSKRVRAVVEFARWGARLVDAPPAEMNTSDFVREARKAARGMANVRITEIKGDALLDQGLGGIHAVGRTAVRKHPPRLLILQYKPKGAKRTYGIVGKGVMYDTGGLNIKTGGHMYGMKCDMGGAAAAVGGFFALAASGFKEAVVCAAGLVENAVGPDSYRPDDILDMHSGHTVEINNTDAEGRLVLGDACSYVSRKFKPAFVMDLATLTGAQLIATGHRHAGIVTNRAGLECATMAAGRSSGDLVFPMPFAPEFYQNEFRSKVADMRNSVADRMNAQSACAGQFVYSHIDDLDQPWLHVDLAGPAFRDGRATGYGVALIADLLDRVRPSDLTA